MVVERGMAGGAPGEEAGTIGGRVEMVGAGEVLGVHGVR
jgi:hypothetical protein